MPYKISLQGNIACGKSTFLKNLEDYLLKKPQIFTFTTLKEPISIWEPFFKAFKDQIIGGYTLQKHIQQSLIQRDSIQYLTDFVIMERSLLSANQVFSPILIQNGDLTQTQFDQLIREQPAHSDQFIVFIETDPTICLSRINIRQQPGDELASLSYLEQIQKRHKMWFDQETRPKLRVYNNTEHDIQEFLSYIISL